MRPRSPSLVPFVVDVVFVVAAALLWSIRPSATWIEHAYTNGFYGALQPVVTGITNAFPFALVDVLLVAVVVGVPLAWIVRIRRAHTARDRWTAVAALAAHTLGLAAFLIVWFTLFWGWNYSRAPLAARIPIDESAINAQNVDRLEALAVEQLNLLAPQAHAVGPHPALTRAALRDPEARAFVDLGTRFNVKRTRPKTSIVNPYLEAAGIDGIMIPFTLETVLNSSLLWFEVPFDWAHEWSHLAGFADETEANFIAAISCLQADDVVSRYSAWIAIFENVPRMPKYDNALSPQVRADYDAIRTRINRKLNVTTWRFAWRSYDRYLKQNHVSSGVVAYSQFVRLLLGTAIGRTAAGL